MHGCTLLQAQLPCPVAEFRKPVLHDTYGDWGNRSNRLDDDEFFAVRRDVISGVSEHPVQARMVKQSLATTHRECWRRGNGYRKERVPLHVEQLLSIPAPTWFCTSRCCDLPFLSSLRKRRDPYLMPAGFTGDIGQKAPVRREFCRVPIVPRCCKKWDWREAAIRFLLQIP